MRERERRKWDGIGKVREKRMRNGGRWGETEDRDKREAEVRS